MGFSPLRLRTFSCHPVSHRANIDASMLKDRADCDIVPSVGPLMLPSTPVIMQSPWQVRILIYWSLRRKCQVHVRRI